MQLWIGTSGYSYQDWIGGFYPRGTRPERMLAYYATQFPLVELNFTFYRLPAPLDLTRLAAKSPSGFQFIVKLHQSLSHEHDLGQAPPFRTAVEALAEAQGGMKSLLLCQYPQRFHQTHENRDRLAALADQFAGFPLAVEFRHATWHAPEVTDWLQHRGLHLVSVDAPAIPALYPSGLVQSSRLIYVRFHSRRASSWYESDKERYDYLYSDDELMEWLRTLAANRDKADRSLLLFNNCHRAQAAANAQRIRELLRQLDLDMEMAAPPAPAAAQQGRLF